MGPRCKHPLAMCYSYKNIPPKKDKNGRIQKADEIKHFSQSYKDLEKIVVRIEPSLLSHDLYLLKYKMLFKDSQSLPFNLCLSTHKYILIS